MLWGYFVESGFNRQFNCAGKSEVQAKHVPRSLSLYYNLFIRVCLVFPGPLASEDNQSTLLIPKMRVCVSRYV